MACTFFEALLTVHLVVGADGPLLENITDPSGLPQTGPTCGLVAVDLVPGGGLELILNLHSNALPPVAIQTAPLEFGIEPLPVSGELDSPDHHGTAVADLDGDGVPEIYLTGGADHGFGWSTQRLLVFDGSVWTDRAAELGLTDPYGRGRSALFLDLAGAADPDLAVLNFRSAPRIFGDVSVDGRATDLVASVWPDVEPAPANPSASMDAPPVDQRERADYRHRLIPGYLLDPETPHYLVFGVGPSLQTRLEDGSLGDAGVEAVAAALARKPVHGLIADLDGDLRNDLYLVRGDGPARSHPAWHNDVFLQVNPGELVEAAREDGALLDGTGHRVRAGDFDNDGHVDLLVLRRKNLTFDRDPALLRGLGGGRFEDVTEQWGLSGFRGGVSQDALLCDLDRDGDLDLVLAQGDHDMPRAIGGYRIYRNHATERGGASVQIELEARDGRDAAAFGARLHFHAGDQVWLRDHWPTQVDNSSMPLPVHVGIGAHAAVDSVVIRWPGGARQVATDLPANSIWKWREGNPPRHLD